MVYIIRGEGRRDEICRHIQKRRHGPLERATSLIKLLSMSSNLVYVEEYHEEKFYGAKNAHVSSGLSILRLSFYV